MKNLTNNLSASLQEMLTSVADQAAMRAVEMYEERSRRLRPAELWTKKQAYTYLQVSYITFQRFIDKGLVKPIQIGKAVRFDADQLKAEMAVIKSHLNERN